MHHKKSLFDADLAEVDDLVEVEVVDILIRGKMVKMKT